jgi:hypothetical protein
MNSDGTRLILVDHIFWRWPGPGTLSLQN